MYLALRPPSDSFCHLLVTFENSLSQTDKMDLKISLHTKYRSSRLLGSREDFIKFNPIISLWKLITSMGVATLDPRGMVGMVYIRNHYTFRAEQFSMFHIISLCEHLTPGVWPV